MIQKLLTRNGQLNTFQQTMLNWSELHPYNAVHVYKMAGPMRASDLREAICQTYLFNGLGVVEFDSGTGSYRHGTDYAPEIEVLPEAASSESRLNEQVARELNRPFERPRCRPFRFGLLGAGPQAHYVLASYDHWVADSVAMRLILRHVIGRYLGLEDAENLRPLSLHPGSIRDLFGRRLGIREATTATGRSFAAWVTSRRVAQVPYLCSREMTVNYELHRTASGTASRLHGFARSLGAKVGDVIQAALGRAIAGALPRRSYRRGRELSMAAIVDTRGDAQADLSNTLGTFLAYYVVRCGTKSDDSLASLTREIAERSARIKSGKRYVESLVDMRLANALWPWLSPRRQTFFMRKVATVTAGVSNVRLRDSWIDRYGADRVLEYARAAPTGPALPLVITPTTRGEQMNVGVTYRTTGFPRARIDAVMSSFLEQIDAPHRCSSARRLGSARGLSGAA